MYTKASAPASDDFKVNEAFGVSKGFSAGYTLIWETSSKTTSIGFAGEKGTEFKANADY